MFLSCFILNENSLSTKICMIRRCATGSKLKRVNRDENSEEIVWSYGDLLYSLCLISFVLISGIVQHLDNAFLWREYISDLILIFLSSNSRLLKNTEKLQTNKFHKSQILDYSYSAELFWAAEFMRNLTHICPIFSFYTPWKQQKTFGFLVFSRGVKWEYWPEMGYKVYWLDYALHLRWRFHL